jgi:hypothetical protein
MEGLSGVREYMEYYLKERGVHRDAMFLSGQGVRLIVAACLYEVRLGTRRDRIEEAFVVTSRSRYYNYFRSVEVGSIA